MIDVKITLIKDEIEDSSDFQSVVSGFCVKLLIWFWNNSNWCYYIRLEFVQLKCQPQIQYLPQACVLFVVKQFILWIVSVQTIEWVSQWVCGSFVIFSDFLCYFRLCTKLVSNVVNVNAVWSLETLRSTLENSIGKLLA